MATRIKIGSGKVLSDKLQLVPQRHLFAVNSLAPQNSSQRRVSPHANVRGRRLPAANGFKERRDMRVPVFLDRLGQNRRLSASLQWIESSRVQVDSSLSSINQSLLPTSRKPPGMAKQ